MTFGELLSRERQQKNYSQIRLANLIETTQRHLSFLETGRSHPSREMIMRVCEALSLPPARRTPLFTAAGFVSPYKTRSFKDVEIVQALELIENEVLNNWPYPAFALTPDWTILLTNGPGAMLLDATPEEIKANPPSFFDILLSASFRQRIVNWQEVSTAFYTRLHRHARDNPTFKQRFDKAVADGLLNPDLEVLATQQEIPAILPMEIRMPDGEIWRITSMAAHFTSVHDSIVSGIEIELMVPLGPKKEAP